MRVLHFLAAPLLASIGIIPGLAQSAQSQQGQSPFTMPSPFPSQPLPATHSFSLPPGAGPFRPALKPGEAQTLSPLRLGRDNLFPAGQRLDILSLQAALQTQRTVIMERNQVCYTVREYTFTRDNPDSDATRMTDYYACRPASNFHVKGIAPTSPR